jgi:16S rRNA (guanine527-N7)-methyltransferase
MPLSSSAKEMLIQAGSLLNLALSEFAAGSFNTLYDALMEGNKSLNLTAIRDENDVVLKHFVDSLTCLTADSFEGGLSLIDVGCGAGFPGLPLKIVRPSLRVIFLDSARKKLEFVQRVCREQLKLTGAEIRWARAEELGHDSVHRAVYDRATARALGSLSVVCELCLPFLKIGGILIAQKGPEVEAELEAGSKAAELLGGRMTRDISLQLPVSGDARRLIVVEKIAATPERFPRRPGIPAKHPLP